MTVYLQDRQLLFALQGQDLPPSAGNAAYAVWLTGPGAKARRLGFTDPVGADGKLGIQGPSQKDLADFPKMYATYANVVVSQESSREREAADQDRAHRQAPAGPLTGDRRHLGEMIASRSSTSATPGTVPVFRVRRSDRVRARADVPVGVEPHVADQPVGDLRGQQGSRHGRAAAVGAGDRVQQYLGRLRRVDRVRGHEAARLRRPELRHEPAARWAEPLQRDALEREVDVARVTTQRLEDRRARRRRSQGRGSARRRRAAGAPRA